MSFHASSWAKRQVTGSPNRKALLMVLAEYAGPHEWEPEDADGRHFCWPRQELLAGDTEMTDRSVRTHLAGLEEQGLIRRLARGGSGEGRQSDLIILAVDDDGPRPFPVDNPGDASVDDDVDNATGKDCRLGATGKSEQGNRKNGAGAPYIEPPKEPASTTKRGTRIPDDFTPDESMRSWYRDNIGAAVNGVLEHEKFMDYWRSRSGQIAVKKDWPAAWRNWMRSALERAPRDYRTTGGPKPAGPRFPTAAERSQMQRDEWAERAKAAEAWVEKQGGDPNDVKLVLSVMERMKTGELNGSASRTSGMYSEGDVIDGQIVPPREVTAGEDS